MMRPSRSEVVELRISAMISGSGRRRALDGAGQRIAAERAEAHGQILHRLAGAQFHALVVAHDQRAVARAPPGAPWRNKAARRGCFPWRYSPTRPPRSSWTAGRRESFRPAACACCRAARVRAAGSSGPSDARPSAARTRAPWRGIFPRRGARRRRPRRTCICRAPASAPASSSRRYAAASRNRTG